ncbi:MAG TPA: acetyl-CoA carboxylase biotin carboxylase subunit [Spirochaetia bacterium]|nr:acetyl-CoA carboxylase biotin carboxylase subunit [Spirochaetia bacterium]
MIKSLLIANRGEIAVRVIRTCREMGIRPVVVYSEADSDSLAVRLADEAVCIGPPSSKLSYLNSRNIVTAAALTGCEAVHPGYGFLAENSGFARDVKEGGLIFVGPEPDVIDLLGDKVMAKKTAIKNKIPVIPGTEDPVTSEKEALKEAETIGFPLIIKAAAGGGGKGMRIVREKEQLKDILKIAAHEAETAFSDGRVYLERYLENPRHVEIQLVADTKGNVIHLGERDCSVQQNHQKLIEETPSPGVTPEMRERMGQDAVRLFKNLHYTGAGTIEFLVQDDQYYFMEVNARVQVEHPVSESISGVDIVREQIRACSGEALSVTQDDITLLGYSLECRINAKAPGTAGLYLPPGGFRVRVDSFLYTGCTILPYYDSMIAKVIVHADSRQEGIARMERALSEFILENIPTNIDQQRTILAHPLFRKGDFGTDLLSKVFKEGKR